MSNEPYFPFYPADYLGDTTHLSLEEQGAYIKLLCVMWRNKSVLDNNPQRLARILGISMSRFEKLWPGICSLFLIDDASITHKRIVKEYKKAVEKIEKKSQAGKKGGAGKHRKNNDTTLTDALTNAKQSEPEPDFIAKAYKESMPVSRPKGYTECFENFWQKYPQNGASKKMAFQSWQKALEKGFTENEITGAIDEYCSFLTRTNTPVAHATTWINQERFTVNHSALTKPASPQRGGSSESTSGNWDKAWGGAAQRDRES